MPPEYSQDLRNLVVAMLLKDDAARPTTSNILDMPFVEKYMNEFIKSRGAIPKRQAFEGEATARVQVQPPVARRPDGPEEKKGGGKSLTARERLQLRKEEESRKKFEAMTLAAKGAYQQMAE